MVKVKQAVQATKLLLNQSLCHNSLKLCGLDLNLTKLMHVNSKSVRATKMRLLFGCATNKKKCGFVILMLLVILCFGSKYSNYRYVDYSSLKEVYLWLNRYDNSELEWKYTQENDTFRKNLLSLNRVLDEPAFEMLDDITIIPTSARIKGRKIFKNKPLVIWATEVHMTTGKDLSNLLTPFGVKFLNYDLSLAPCHLHDCRAKEKLKVLTNDNAINADRSVAQRFYEAYKDDEEMKSVDVIFCGHPASICEIYLPLNKSVIVLPSTRYDIGRYTVERWTALNENLQILAEKPWNIFGGNNLYDAKYLQYYTGIKVHHLPSVCDSIEAQYTCETDEFLVLRKRGGAINKHFQDTFDASCKQMNCTVKLRWITGYTYRDLASNRGVIHVPYQLSVMTIFEMYRMNIPMFFPSPELLARWQVDYYLMNERSFDGAFFGKRPNASIIPPHPSQKGIPDPKNEFDYESILYWVKTADFYQVMPYGVIYENIPQLMTMLNSIDNNRLWKISRNMQNYNVEFKKALLTKWRDILLEFANHSPNNPN